ncbi:MAG: type II secretion system protein [Verrucomicrobia bacterium]|nr:type II secretion system protein [Verrucomicrobiota bacterium]
MINSRRGRGRIAEFHAAVSQTFSLLRARPAGGAGQSAAAAGGKPAIQQTASLRYKRSGFTLIELLVVFSIIALLAGLSVGLVGVASRKNKESRVKAELNKYVTAIENYKAAIGSFPPDNPGKPSTNQLFYELSGTVYTRNKFEIPGSEEGILDANVRPIFGRSGFANSSRDEKELKFTEEVKPAQYKEVNIPGVDIEVLAVPVNGPKTSTYNGVSFPLQIPARVGAVPINPWMYDSSSPNRNNPNGFDLWAEVVIGRDIIRFSNWEKDPTVIGRQ